MVYDSLDRCIMLDIYNISAWLGIICCLSAYGANQCFSLSSESFSYRGLNLLAAVFILFSNFGHFNISSVMINAFIGGVSLYNIVIYNIRRKI